MSTMGERIKESREKKGIYQAQLAEMIGVKSAGVISNWEKNINKPDADKIIRLCYALDVLPSYLLDYYGENIDTFTALEKEHIKKYRLLDGRGKESVDAILDLEYKHTIETQKEISHRQMAGGNTVSYFYVPEYREPASAGTGQPIGTVYPESIMLIKEPPDGTSFITHVRGDSMEPDFEDGDMIFIHAQSEIRAGQIGVFFMDGEEFIKELGEGELISHNTKYEPISLDENIRCQGLVLGICDESYLEE